MSTFIWLSIIFIVTCVLIVQVTMKTDKILNNKYVKYINDKTLFHYKRDSSITCIIEKIEYKNVFTKNPKLTIVVTYNNNKQFNLVTTKLDFEELWEI